MSSLGTHGCTGAHPESKDMWQLRSLSWRDAEVVESGPRVQAHVAAQEPDRGPGTHGREPIARDVGVLLQRADIVV
jgi:hypothetical protein